jgi:hypothetical protein
VTVASPKLVGSLSAIVLAVTALALFPSDALAWTPGTHVYLGDAVLRSMSMLPGNIAGLLAAFPYDFLYSPGFRPLSSKGGMTSGSSEAPKLA